MDEVPEAVFILIAGSKDLPSHGNVLAVDASLINNGVDPNLILRYFDMGTVEENSPFTHHPGSAPLQYLRRYATDHQSTAGQFKRELRKIPKAKVLFVYYDNHLGSYVIYFADGTTMAHDEFVGACAERISAKAVESVVLVGNGCISEVLCESAKASAERDAMLVIGTARKGIVCYSCLGTADRPAQSDFFARAFVAELNRSDRGNEPLTSVWDHLRVGVPIAKVQDKFHVPGETTSVPMYHVVAWKGAKTTGILRESVLGKPQGRPLFWRDKFGDEQLGGLTGEREANGDIIFPGAFLAGNSRVASVLAEGEPFTMRDVARIAGAMRTAELRLDLSDTATEKRWSEELAPFSTFEKVEAERWQATPCTIRVMLANVLFRGVVQNADRKEKAFDVFCAALGAPSVTEATRVVRRQPRDS
jgi:hypothetical protein